MKYDRIMTLEDFKKLSPQKREEQLEVYKKDWEAIKMHNSIQGYEDMEENIYDTALKMDKKLREKGE